jgi:hypothetical protein
VGVGAGASYAELEMMVRGNWRGSDLPLNLAQAMAMLVEMSLVYVVEEGGRDWRDRQYRPIYTGLTGPKRPIGEL